MAAELSATKLNADNHVLLVICSSLSRHLWRSTNTVPIGSTSSPASPRTRQTKFQEHSTICRARKRSHPPHSQGYGERCSQLFTNPRSDPRFTRRHDSEDAELQTQVGETTYRGRSPTRPFSETDQTSTGS